MDENVLQLQNDVSKLMELFKKKDKSASASPQATASHLVMNRLLGGVVRGIKIYVLYKK